VPTLEASLATFRELANRVGPSVLSGAMIPLCGATSRLEFHQQTYERIARTLRGYTRRSVISLLDIYRKAEKRLKALTQQGIELATPDEDELGKLMHTLVEIATANNLEITSCAEQLTCAYLAFGPAVRG